MGAAVAQDLHHLGAVLHRVEMRLHRLRLRVTSLSASAVAKILTRIMSINQPSLRHAETGKHPENRIVKNQTQPVAAAMKRRSRRRQRRAPSRPARSRVRAARMQRIVGKRREAEAADGAGFSATMAKGEPRGVETTACQENARLAGACRRPPPRDKLAGSERPRYKPRRQNRRRGSPRAHRGVFVAHDYERRGHRARQRIGELEQISQRDKCHVARKKIREKSTPASTTRERRFPAGPTAGFRLRGDEKR